MNYSIKVDHELKIIRYKHSGKLSFTDIGEAWGEFLSLKEFTEGKYNLLSDYREAIFDMKVEQIDDIIEFMRGIKQIVRGKKQSIIIHDPYSTAGSIIFSNKVYQEIGFEIKIFSTEPAAIGWLEQA